jgi:hypothetical protein
MAHVFAELGRIRKKKSQRFSGRQGPLVFQPRLRPLHALLAVEAPHPPSPWGSDPLRWSVLCEGPLDAARVGPGGIALIGSSISPENAEKVASAFHVVFTAFDEDRAGKEATARIGKMILGAKQRAPLVQMVVPLQIASGKDIGEMSQEQFDALLQKTLRRVKREL